ncbi:hypothetical protein F1559_000375 [Cyanidiococcus yangmingshanensis]|uniref:Uncharacterized protein n=1 Tax=Cyanidiococcus yangmingshanensis TaxID=2690220 RepID=A0A7J7IGQ2_9RHOD|nr:hypothetical protein F1559_000375 [Cyanidiococcus yangmingshanensis]
MRSKQDREADERSGEPSLVVDVWLAGAVSVHGRETLRALSLLRWAVSLLKTPEKRAMFVFGGVGIIERSLVPSNERLQVFRTRVERRLAPVDRRPPPHDARATRAPTRFLMSAEPEPINYNDQEEDENGSAARCDQLNGQTAEARAWTTGKQPLATGSKRTIARAQAGLYSRRLDYRTRLDLRRFQLWLQILLEDLVATPLTWYHTLRNRRAEYAQMPQTPSSQLEPDCRACHGLGFETCGHCKGLGHRYFWGSSRREEYDRMVRSGEARHWRTMLYGLFHIERREVRCRRCRGFGWVSCPVCHGHKLPKEWETMYL